MATKKKRSNPRPNFQVVIYEEETEWIDPEDPDGYEQTTDEVVNDDNATLEDVINYAEEYGIAPRIRNDLTSWWESHPDNEYDFTRNVSRIYTMHVDRNGKDLSASDFKRINRLINDRVWKGSERVANPAACGRGKVRIQRKAYTRKAYTDKRGRKVGKTRVPASSFCIEDQGRPGVRSFGAKQGKRKGTKPLIQKEGKLGGPGYTKKPVATRHRLLAKCVKRDGYKSCLGRLQAVLLSSELKPATRRTWEADKAWLVKTYGGPGSVGPRRKRRKNNPEAPIDTRMRAMAARLAAGG